MSSTQKVGHQMPTNEPAAARDENFSCLVQPTLSRIHNQTITS